jgi:hypothetical protein
VSRLWWPMRAGKLGFEGHRAEAARLALSFRPLSRLPRRPKKNPARAGQVPRERNSRTAGGIGGSGSRPARLKGLVAFCRFEVQSAAPTLEAAKADFEASWRQWLAWAKLKEVH